MRSPRQSVLRSFGSMDKDTQDLNKMHMESHSGATASLYIVILKNFIIFRLKCCLISCAPGLGI